MIRKKRRHKEVAKVGSRGGCDEIVCPNACGLQFPEAKHSTSKAHAYEEKTSGRTVEIFNGTQSI